MEKQIYDETNGLWYERQGDYYLPCLAIPEHRPIGVWGERHRRYLRENKHAVYSGLLLSGKLDAYLADIDRQAEALFARLMKELAQREGVAEEFKAADQIAWVGAMNGIRQSKMYPIKWTVKVLKSKGSDNKDSKRQQES